MLAPNSSTKDVLAELAELQQQLMDNYDGAPDAGPRNLEIQNCAEAMKQAADLIKFFQQCIP